jgi:hypothetical protein
LFISILSAASCGHPLQVSAVPRGARIVRVAMVMIDARSRPTRFNERIEIRKRRVRCQTENEKFFT